MYINGIWSHHALPSEMRFFFVVQTISSNVTNDTINEYRPKNRIRSAKLQKKNRRLKLMSISSKQKRRSNGIMHSFVPTHSLCDPITEKIYQDNETIEWNREVYTYCDGRKKETFHRFRWGVSLHFSITIWAFCYNCCMVS